MKKKQIAFMLNTSVINTEVNPSLPLLDFIRKEKQLIGTKEVCKEGDCGACTVLLGTLQTDGKLHYQTITSCIYPIANCNGKHIVTIEGINKSGLLLHQQAFVDENASQCGFCTPGFIMSITCYLLNNEQYKIEEAINAVSGNICRCTGYHSIERALKNIIEELNDRKNKDVTEFLIEKNIIPEHFRNVNKLIKNIPQQKIEREEKPQIFIGGGSDLFVQKADELLELESEFLSNNNSLKFIKEENDIIEIGSCTSFEDIKQSEVLSKYFPSLKKDVDLIASLPVRNAATIGGNLSNASPIGDITIILLALNAKLHISKNGNERTLPLKKYYLDYKKLNKEKNEFIKSISLSIPKNKFKFSFEKVSKRTYLDIASVNTAMFIEFDDDSNETTIESIRISAGGIAPIPKLLEITNQFLTDKIISYELIEEALNITKNEISPISDVRGSAEYKRLLLNQLIKAHFLKLFPEKISEDMLI